MIISPFLGILKNWLVLAAIIPGYCWYDHPEIRSNKGIQYNPPCDRGTCVAIFRSVNVFLAGIRPWPSLCGNGFHAGRLYIYNIYLYITHIYIYITLWKYLRHCHGQQSIYGWFTYWTWWFSTAMLCWQWSALSALSALGHSVYPVRAVTDRGRNVKLLYIEIYRGYIHLYK